MADDSPTERLTAFEVSLGLRKGFIFALRKEDDWSFVIKAHALLEAGLSELLAHQLGTPTLKEVFAKLTISNKLRFASKLDLMEKPFLGFVRALGEIRNDFVHNISNAEINLLTYLNGLNADQLESKRKALDLIFRSDEAIDLGDGVDTPADKIFQKAPKLIIASGLGVVLRHIHVLTTVAKTSGDMVRVADDLFRDLFLEAMSARQAARTKRSDPDGP